jgi:hypothetical protein
MAGKGDNRRPQQISKEEFDLRWSHTFSCGATLENSYDNEQCICVEPRDHKGEHVCGCGNAWWNLGDPE